MTRKRVLLGLSGLFCLLFGTCSLGTDIETLRGRLPKENAYTDAVFNSITALGDWLSSQPANTAATAYTVALNVNDLGGDSETPGSLGYVLQANSSKYVSINLSGSTITSIGGGTFYKCTRLTNITIPNSVTSIGERAFENCTSLASVTFQGTISSSNFDSTSFPGDLRDKYLANGIGTYTRAGGSTWTKQ